MSASKSVRRVVLLTLAAACCACGDPAPIASPAGTPAAPIDHRGYKREARIGHLVLQVDSRPRADRAWLVADWRSGPMGENCELVLVLPDRVTVLEGETRTPLAAEQDAGQVRWLLSFPTDETLDATVRLCAQRDDGGPNIIERAVRLVDLDQAAR